MCVCTWPLPLHRHLQLALCSHVHTPSALAITVANPRPKLLDLEAPLRTTIALAGTAVLTKDNMVYPNGLSQGDIMPSFWGPEPLYALILGALYHKTQGHRMLQHAPTHT